jgi:anaerobic dimethyl sulfoxide reductase subunit A
MEGVWKTAACMNNCSCGSSRCLLRAYVVDGVPTKLITDQEDEDTIWVPQRRACGRGRAQISNVLSADRVKYPMKRAHWEPLTGGDKSMRGKDEWVRISWDEAIDIFYTETKNIIDKYGSTRAILQAAYSDIGDTYFDQVICLFNELGGSVHHEMGTVSMGSWPLTEILMAGTAYDCPDYLGLMESDLHFYFGCNWQANKGGNTAYHLSVYRDRGARVIIVDPWLNQTAQAVADEWVGIRPGTDITFVLGMAYHMIENNLHDQDYLDKYCVGFDAEHMPEGAPANGSFKDYVLGTFDGTPKTPEWASAICGVPADTITRLAEEIADTEKVAFFAGQSTTKHQAGEQFAQAFYTLGLMHGGIGTPGNYVSWYGVNSLVAPLCAPGDASNGAGLNPVNPVSPAALGYMLGSIPNFAAPNLDMNAWDLLEYTECWQSCLDGEYGRDIWPGGKKKIDIHMIYCGGYENSLNSLPHSNAGIELFRQVDFVAAANPFFCPSARYADLVLPIATWWEKADLAWTAGPDTVFWADQIIEPLYESWTEAQVAIALAEKFGIDPKKVDTMTKAERTYYSLKDAFKMVADGGPVAPLITLTQADLDELGVDGEPQEGELTLAEFKAKGFYKAQRSEGDNLIHIPYKAFYDDPEGSPLGTASGKFEIYCAALAAVINSVGFSTIDPVGKYHPDPDEGQGAQTDEYPLLLWTPHTLRRAHTVNDSVTSLREAFPQPCFISEYDAKARGIANGDIVLMSSPYGQVLRPAQVLPTVMPGCVALQDGSWLNIDEATGIDIGGNPNTLQAPKASGQASQSWSGTICQVEKYTGNIRLEPDKRRALVLPQGIE